MKIASSISSVDKKVDNKKECQTLVCYEQTSYLCIENSILEYGIKKHLTR
ncbi:MAG: hypothetical protein Q4F45_09145 [Alistipes sp.]|nr:hypothetical protein [Alistipes sp.]